MTASATSPGPAPDARPLRVLLLGGTADARALAARLDADPRVHVVSSLAGRTADPVLPPGASRIGGFGGVAGLLAHLRGHGVDVVVDATHPFAARMSANASAACATDAVPLLRLVRPGWLPTPTDHWHRVPDHAAAAAALPALGRRVFLTTGRLETAAYAGLDDLWFLLRSIDPPDGPLPRTCEILLARGPFTLTGEVRLMTDRRVDVLVTKDSGGSVTAAKLDAARYLGLPVVMIDRPAAPDGDTAVTVPNVARAAAWVAGHALSPRRRP